MSLVTFTAGQILTADDLNDSFTAVNVIKGYGYNLVATSQTTSSATYTDLATVGPTVTITTGTSAIVILGANMTSGNITWANAMSFEVSGATTIAASDDRKVDVVGDPTSHSVQRSASRVILLDGTLTAGSNTFTAKYRATSTVTATFAQRSLIVLPL